MGNRKVDVCKISKEVILGNMKKAGYSIRKLAEKTHRSERTIRSYLHRGEMPEWLVREIDDVLRPKENWIPVQFRTWISVSDDELKGLIEYAIDGDTDPDCAFHDVELESFEAEDLWSLKGEMIVTGASIYGDYFESYRDFAEKASLLVGTDIKNKEDANNGKGKI